MNSTDLDALYDVQKEIGAIFTKMKRDSEEEGNMHVEASLNLEKSAQMVSQLNDFIDKYGSDTLEESDALAAAVMAEAEYINTLKGKIEEAESESNTISSTYSHMEQLSGGIDSVGEYNSDIHAEIECKTAVMKFLLSTYPSPDFFVEDVTAEYGSFYNHVDGGTVARWEAIFLVQNTGKSDGGSNNMLYLVNMRDSSTLDDVENSVRDTCNAMTSREPIGRLPLVSFIKRMTIIGARELGYVAAKGKGAQAAGAGAVSEAELRAQMHVMVVVQRGDKKRGVVQAKKKGFYALEKSVTATSSGEDDMEDEIEFSVLAPPAGTATSRKK